MATLEEAGIGNNVITYLFMKAVLSYYFSASNTCWFWLV